MKAIILLIILCQVALGDDIVYRQIVNNKPNIDTEKAKMIAKYIDMAHKKYKIPKRVYAAILMQESSYKLSAVNRSSSDFGISQINKRTAKAFGFCTKRLTTDLKYSIDAGAIVLADFQRMYGKKDPLWFTRYHHSKPSLRKRYLQNISRWMTKDLQIAYAEHYE
jgi:hypothetical protein